MLKNQTVLLYAGATLLRAFMDVGSASAADAPDSHVGAAAQVGRSDDHAVRGNGGGTGAPAARGAGAGAAAGAAGQDPGGSLKAAEPSMPASCVLNRAAFTELCKRDAASPDSEHGSRYLLCIGADGQSTPQELYGPKGHLLLPNRMIEVRIRHPNGAMLEVKGTPGPGLVTPTVKTSGMEAASLDACQESVAWLLPRPSGAMSIKTTVKTGASERSMDTELMVKEFFFGALRTGLGLVTLGATDRTYDLRREGTMGPSQIVATNVPNVDFELTFGFAPFLFDLAHGGRSYVDSENLKNFPFGFAPYIGVGVLGTSQGSGSVDVFKTLYAGLEWEPMPNFSVAVTYVLRRVTRLDGQYAEGSMVMLDKPPTVTTHESGLGIVLNMSPDFFRFNKGK